MRIAPIEVKLPSFVIREFKKEAKAAFPNETLAYILGTVKGNKVQVEELWWPTDVSSFAAPESINIQPYWAAEAQEYASENSLQILGTIHTHPYRWGEIKNPDRSPSENDMDSELASYGLIGICTVVEGKTKKLRCSLRLWSPMLDVETKET